MVGEAGSPIRASLRGWRHGHEITTGPGVARGAKYVARNLRTLSEAAQVVAKVERDEVLQARKSSVSEMYIKKCSAYHEGRLLALLAEMLSDCRSRLKERPTKLGLISGKG